MTFDRFALWFCVLVSVFCSLSASAQSPLSVFEQAMMPGPVIEGHAKYENDCEECHVRFEKDKQNTQCLECHKEVRADVQKKEGFHGRLPNVESRPCKVCHTDHKGRDFNIVLLDVSTFNHDQTDFKLRDSHTRVKCASCHDPKKKYREAPKNCVDCHKKDEPHQGKLGKKCEICHNETRWPTFVFDHAKTDFDLKGKHVGVECGFCHVNERYQGIPKKCAVCHKLDDKHKGRFGDKCEDCHGEQSWHDINFDHNIDTDFKLEGQHKQVSCGQCHKGKNIYKEDLKTDCYSCHKFKDEHKGQYGKKCEDCHKADNWKDITFDHDIDTDWELKGKHKKVKCIDCHRGELYEEETPTECYDCHRQDDVHDGQEGKDCGKCHSEEGWIKQVDFDHDLTRFPLLGSHATVACEECHTTTSFKDAGVKCVECHQGDDVHEKRMGPNCYRCHNSVDWKLWVFDHDTETDFKLEGKHKKIHCEECHAKPVKDEPELPADCFSCHEKDDAHNGSYGRLCNRCHNPESFKDFSPRWRQ